MKYIIRVGTKVNRFAPTDIIYSSLYKPGWEMGVTTDYEVCFEETDKVVVGNVEWKYLGWKTFSLPKECEPWTIIEVSKFDLETI